MAPAIESRAVGGIALFATFVAAKLAAIAAIGAPSLADLPQLGAVDAVIALAFAAVVRVVRLRTVAALAYAVLVVHAAFSTAVVQAIGTPISWPMLAGIDPAMGDSAGQYVALRDLAGALTVIAVGLLAPFAVRRMSRRAASAALWIGVAIALPIGIGPSPQLPAHRNALGFLMLSARAPDATVQAAGTRPLHAVAPDPTRAALRGSAAGSDVVVVVLESAAARFLHPYGAAEDPMPFVSELADRGLLCENAYAVYPESIKGQIALFHAVHPAPATDAQDYARIPVPGLGTLLGARGYATGLFHAGRFRFLGMDHVLLRSGFAHRADAATIGGDRESSFGVDEESTVDALLAWIDAQATGPVFAAYLPVAGHHPYESPEGGPFDYDTQLGCYRNALHYADQAVRRLWDGLVARGRADRTLLVVVGDHGQAFGEHDGNFGHTFGLFEENLRVPLVLTHRGIPGLRGRLTRVVSHVDLAPTILDLLGAPPCAGHEGSSLFAAVERPALFFADWGARLVGIRDGRWKLIRDCDTGIDRLFDLGPDPRELDDRATAEPERVGALRSIATDFFGPRSRAIRAW